MVNFSPEKVQINWTIPSTITDTGSGTWDSVNIYRSTHEDQNYNKIDTIVYGTGNSWIASYIDETTGALRTRYYLVRYLNSSTDEESDWILTFFSFSPREMRLIESVKVGIDRFSKLELTDKIYMSGLTLALQHFNVLSPTTNYTLSNFPRTHEIFLILGGQAMTILQKYLDVSIRDFSSSDSGLSLVIDRGSKMQIAIDRLMASYNATVQVAKFDLAAFKGNALGTLQLPLSIGTNLGSNILNVLNVFSGVG